MAKLGFGVLLTAAAFVIGAVTQSISTGLAWAITAAAGAVLLGLITDWTYDFTGHGDRSDAPASQSGEARRTIVLVAVYLVAALAADLLISAHAAAFVLAFMAVAIILRGAAVLGSRRGRGPSGHDGTA